jgi:hypothetical protein
MVKPPVSSDAATSTAFWIVRKAPPALLASPSLPSAPSVRT